MTDEKIKEVEEKEEKQSVQEYAIQYFSKDFIGITANTIKRRRKYTRAQVRNYLVDPFKNYQQLQDISLYLKAQSGNYYRIIKYLAGLPTLDYFAYPSAKAKLDNPDKILKDYTKTAETLDKMRVKQNFRFILERLLEHGEVYLYEIEDSKGITYREMPSSYCRISFIENGVYLYEVDMNQFSDDTIEEYPVEFQNAYKRRDSLEDGWYPVSDKGFAFNAIGQYNHGFPVLSFMFDDLMGLEDTKDLNESKDKLDAIKLIHQKIPLDANKEKPVFDMEIAKIYHDATKRGLPDGVAVTTNPLDITSVPFDKAMTRELDGVARAERNIWNSSGISDMVFGNQKASGEALKRSIISDETWILPFVLMFESYINKKISNTKFQISFLETTYYNREEIVKTMKDSLSFGGSRTQFLAATGLEPLHILNIFKFEQDVLGIDDMLIPKPTSHTMSGSESGDESGRPTQEEVGEEPTESTENDRERQ